MTQTRQASLEAVQAYEDIQVLIIGGGVNGIGLLRELAAQGIDTVLVEQNDFCSGASAASSHMLHGGLRYLENGEFRLVREALHERNRMLHNAPHHAKPLPTTIPIFSWRSGLLNAPLKFLNLLDKPSERGAIVIKLGLTFYDLFTLGNRAMPWHKLYSRSASLKKRPYLNPEIIATATYYDALMPSPERICIELLQDAEALHPRAHALNYVGAVGGDGERVTLRDHLTGDEFQIKPQIVVNAAGPWIDLTNQALKQPTRFIGGTKGAHLVVDNPELHTATQGHEMFFENEDGRIVLFFALGDKVLMGTTDIPTESPETVCTEEEIAYILALVRRVFPRIEVKREQIVFTFSGVRPLPASEADKPGQISRDHSVRITEPSGATRYPIFSLVGGKWTTYRAFAEQTADKILPRLGANRKMSTAYLPLRGGKDYPREAQAQSAYLKSLSAEHGLTSERVQLLFERYGTQAAEIAAFCAAEPDQALSHLPSYSRREVIYLTLNEKIAHLDDFVLRRSLVGMLGQLTCALTDELAEIIGGVLGWSDAARKAEVERLIELMRTRHLVELR